MKKRFRFILVDDDPFALALEEKLIQGLDECAETISFACASEALTFIVQEYDWKKNAIPTVILTDLHMPETDGLALLDSIEELENVIKGQFHVFVLSAAASPIEVQKARSHYFVKGCHSKPLSSELVNQIIKRIQYPD
ncbi:MAG TPA: response regulator [Puia sp.]|nr:response regulator [Puia sp.]